MSRADVACPDEHDTSSLVFLNNRYHDPQLGVFISVDPLVMATREPYIYASGNPTTLSDPTGLEACSLTGSCDSEYESQKRILENKAGACGRRLDCGEHEIRYLTAEQRLTTLTVFGDSYAVIPPYGHDWFAAIRAVTQVWNEDGAFEFGWVSVTNASIVHGILDGMRTLVDRQYGSGSFESPNASSSSWAELATAKVM